MIENHVIAFLNACMCGTSGIIFLCRLNAMRRGERKVRFLVQAEYAVGVGAMFASGLSPWWYETPGYATLIVAFYILVQLIASTPAWRPVRGAQERPPESATTPAPL